VAGARMHGTLTDGETCGHEPTTRLLPERSPRPRWRGSTRGAWKRYMRGGTKGDDNLIRTYQDKKVWAVRWGTCPQ
jgi:hypothetical protein